MAKWGRRNNCYSYAVDYPNKWLLVEHDEFKTAIWHILEANPNFKLVYREDVVLGKEYVAYRFCKNDFHFMKRGKDGHWRHKMGGCDVEAISTKTVFGKVWDCGSNVYNSKLYLFEVQ